MKQPNVNQKAVDFLAYCIARMEWCGRTTWCHSVRIQHQFDRQAPPCEIPKAAISQSTLRYNVVPKLHSNCLKIRRLKIIGFRPATNIQLDTQWNPKVKIGKLVTCWEINKSVPQAKWAVVTVVSVVWSCRRKGESYFVRTAYYFERLPSADKAANRNTSRPTNSR